MATTCKIDGAARPDNLSLPCPGCGAKKCFLGWYLLPEDCHGVQIAFYLVIGTLVAVALFYVILRIYLAHQINAFLPIALPLV